MSSLLKKHLDKKLCTGLTLKEFQCRCDDCDAVMVDDDFLKAYESLRRFIGLPFFINSGYRCQAHNKIIGGQILSRHLVGKAVDIDASNILLKYGVLTFKQIAKACGFKLIVYYKDTNFFHLNV